MEILSLLSSWSGEVVAVVVVVVVEEEEEWRSGVEIEVVRVEEVPEKLKALRKREESDVLFSTIVGVMGTTATGGEGTTSWDSTPAAVDAEPSGVDGGDSFDRGDDTSGWCVCP
jgi:hypothetical protein